jgi:cell division protease FtsH
MDNPDVAGRLEILKVHAKGKPLAPDADLQSLAKITPGFSGADLENLINEAAILTARRNKKTIGMSELQESMERVIMGPERKTRVMSEQEKLTTAYHEAGHAILFYVLETHDPAHKITIIPRGRAGGYTMALPEEDRHYVSLEQFSEQIVALMGGRAAEELVFNQFTTGAYSDLQRATSLARSMVTQYGMSEVLGPRTFGSGHTSVFLGREIGEQRDYSEEVAEQIDKEVKRIVENAYSQAMKLLKENKAKLEEVAKILIERETLDREGFEALMSGSSTAGGLSETAPAMGD